MVGDLGREIENEYYSFDVLQMVQVVKEILDDGDGEEQGRIFFEADPSLAFPPSDIGAVKFIGNDCKVSIPVLNLLGSSSPLPVDFSDHIARGLQDADMYCDFLSIMQNRLHSLWIDAHHEYALWSNGGSVAKMMLESMTSFSSCQADFYADALSQLGIFSRRTRSAADLKSLLRSTWKGISVHIEENVSRWTSISNRRSLGRNLRLGQTALGPQILDRASKFRVSLGPLDYGMYASFLPGESNYQHLQKIITLYLNDPLICELEISCERKELAMMRVGGNGEDRGGRLGRTGTLGKARAGETHRYRREI
jgi:type VI secretion system protein ImpH